MGLGLGSGLGLGLGLPAGQLARRAAVPGVEEQELARLARAEGEHVDPQPQPRRVVGAREGEEQRGRRERGGVAAARGERGGEAVHATVEGLVGRRVVGQVRLAAHPRADEGGVEGELVRVHGAREELGGALGLLVLGVGFGLGLALVVGLLVLGLGFGLGFA